MCPAVTFRLELVLGHLIDLHGKGDVEAEVIAVAIIEQNQGAEPVTTRLDETTGDDMR